MNDNSRITVDHLRSRLTDDQRAILDAIWDYYQEHVKDKRWISTRRLHQAFRREVVFAAFRGLGGSVVREDGYGPDAHYSLSFLGVLLANRGAEAEDLLVRYLEYVRQRFGADPDISGVDGVDVESALNITKDESRFLRDLIDWGHFVGGSSSFGESWRAGVPNDVDELPQDAQELRAYVHNRALERFDPNLPFEQNKRDSYVPDRERREEPRSPFWFITDPKLRQQLTEDWQEAENVYKVEAWKSYVILCGGILEGMLLDALGRDAERARAKYKGKKRSLNMWSLDELVNTANAIGILEGSDLHLSRALQEYRNLVHPGRQVRKKIIVGEDQATVARVAVRSVLQALTSAAG